MGGGFVGLCAGAYLASSGYDWSLGILDALVVDREHWARGRGEVDVHFTPAGRVAASAGALRADLRYVNGPLYEPAGREDLPDYEVWATYESEINTNGAPEGVMLGKPAIVLGEFGAGRVVATGHRPTQHQHPQRRSHAAEARGPRGVRRGLLE